MTHQASSSDRHETNISPDDLFSPPRVDGIKRLYACAKALSPSQPNIYLSFAAALWQAACVTQGRYNVTSPNGETNPLSLSVVVNTENPRHAMRALETWAAPLQAWEQTAYPSYQEAMKVFEEENTLSKERIAYRKKALHEGWTKNDGVAIKRQQAYVDSLREAPTRPRKPRLLHKDPAVAGLYNALNECFPAAGMIIEGVTQLTPPDASHPVELLEIASGRPLETRHAIHYQPSVSLMAVITPQQRHAATEEHMTSDAWLSCVYVDHLLSPGAFNFAKVFKSSPDCIAVYDKLAYLARQHSILLHAPAWTPTSLTFEENANAHWHTVKQSLEQWVMSQPGLSDVSMYTLRIPDLSTKLAALIHLMEEDDPSAQAISLDTLKAGMWLAYKSLHTFQAMQPFHHRDAFLADTLCEWLEHLDPQGQRSFTIDEVLNDSPFLSRHEAWQAVDALWRREDITLSGYDGQLEVQWPGTSHTGQSSLFAQQPAYPSFPAVQQPTYPGFPAVQQPICPGFSAMQPPTYPGFSAMQQPYYSQSGINYPRQPTPGGL